MLRLDPVCRSRRDFVLIRSAWLSVAPGSNGFVAHFPVWKALTVAIVVPRLDLQGESDCSYFSRIVSLISSMDFVVGCGEWLVRNGDSHPTGA